MKYAFTILLLLALGLIYMSLFAVKQGHEIDSLQAQNDSLDSVIKTQYHAISEINKSVAADTAAIGRLSFDSSVSLLRANLRYGLFEYK